MLSEPQKKIVNATDKNILCLASAGTGKTTTLTQRIEHLVETGVDPTKIVAFTFTNEAANEMRRRLSEKCKDVFVGTIHAYAAIICGRAGIDVAALVLKEKFDDIIIKAYEADMTYYLPVEHLLLDEVQDTSEKQYNFVKKIPAINRFYAGDFRQQIYSFRLKDPDFIFNELENTTFKTYHLIDNYRSPQNIIDFGERFIGDFMVDHDLPKSKAASGRKSAYINEMVGFNQILDYLAYDVDKDDYVNWSVLCRTNIEVEYVEEKFKENGIPCCIVKRDKDHYEQAQEDMLTNKVKIMTQHSSKGLSLPKVVVMDVRTYSDEERRLAYVASTRAQEELYICSPPKGLKSWDKERKNAGMVSFG